MSPFSGSSTTGIAANLAHRRFLGMDMETEFLAIRKKRKLAIENATIAESCRQKINGFNNKKELSLFLVKEPKEAYQLDIVLQVCIL